MWYLLLALLSPLAQSAPFSQYVELFYRTEKALQEFDQELERSRTPGLLLRSASYAELLRLRAEMEAMAHEVEPAAALSPAEKLAADHLAEHLLSHGQPGVKPVFANSAERMAFRRIHSQEIAERLGKKRRDPESPMTAARKESGLSAIEPGTGANGNISGYNFPERTWALTYDDGPSAKNTLPILELLVKHRVKATFFWLAENIPHNLSVVEAVRNAGMALANHSYTHANLPKVNATVLRKEVVGSSELQSGPYGERPRFFRCPYGAGLNVGNVRKEIADAGMIHVFWNVDSLDWQDKNPQSVLARVKKQMEKEKKGVVLFHDIHATTVETSRLLLEYSAGLEGKPQALRWVTLPEIVEELNSR